jgi:hypothetical protein
MRELFSGLEVHPVVQKFTCPRGHQWQPAEAMPQLSLDADEICPVCGLKAQPSSEAFLAISSPVGFRNPMTDAEAILETPFTISESVTGSEVRRARSRGFRIGIILAVALGLAVVLYGLDLHFKRNRIHWVGHSDLEITFIVTDAQTDQPIRGAKIEVLAEEGNLCERREKPPFHFNTDANGIAISFHKCMCSGTIGWSWGGRIDTFHIHIPGWLLRVSAPGYTTTDPFWIETWENPRPVERGTDFAKLKVPVQLQKAK